jgi:hypothetical protein
VKDINFHLGHLLKKIYTNLNNNDLPYIANWVLGICDEMSEDN